MARIVNIVRMSNYLGLTGCLSVASFGLNQLLKVVKRILGRNQQTFRRTTSL